MTIRMMTRRTALKVLQFAGIAAAVPATTIAAPREMTARERFDHHFAEMKKAAHELNPAIYSWQLAKSEDDDIACALQITAYRATGSYQGDGTYEAAREKPMGGRLHYTVQFLNHHSDGQRLFSVSTPMDSMRVTEARLVSLIGRKIA